MNSAQIERRLRAFEGEHDLLKHELDGWCVWPLLRLAVGYGLEQFSLAPRARLGRVQRSRLMVEDMAGLARLRRAPFFVKSSLSGLVDEREGLYDDVWFGGLLATLPAVVKVDGVTNPAFLPRRARARHRAGLTTTLFDTAAAVLTRTRIPPDVSVVARKVADSLRAEFASDRFPAVWVERTLARFFWSKRIYTKILSRVRPRVVLSADPGEYALVAAAREQGIRVLELQHGSIDRDHHAYGWSEYACQYRDQMPLPDELLLYGAYWKQELDHHGFWGGTTRVVGSLRMDTYRSRRSARPEGDHPTILVTTQGIETERVVQFLSAFLRQTSETAFRLIIKLHPACEQKKDVYLAAVNGDPRVSVLLGSEGFSTFDLLTRADLHVSVSSTCHYEAIGLGVPTAVLPFATHEIVRPLVDAGHAILLQSSGDLGALVANDAAHTAVSDAVSGHYFAHGALDAVRERLGLSEVERSGPGIPLGQEQVL